MSLPLKAARWKRCVLDNMNHGLTQVVLLRFRLAKMRATPSSLSVNVRLSYYDPEQKEQVVKIQESYLMAKDCPLGDMLKDPEVGKNYSIAQLAQAIRDHGRGLRGATLSGSGEPARLRD